MELDGKREKNPKQTQFAVFFVLLFNFFFFFKKKRGRCGIYFQVTAVFFNASCKEMCDVDSTDQSHCAGQGGVFGGTGRMLY